MPIAELLVVVGPAALAALGALIALAAEPFLADHAKHRVLPWVGAAFLAGAMVAQAAVVPGPGAVVDLHGLLALDRVRAWLALTVLGCGLAAMAGLQHSLARDRHPGGEAYALTVLATVGAVVMVLAVDLVALFVGLELASIAVYAAVGLRRHRLEAGEGLFKYLVMGAVFSALLLYGVALVFGATGSTGYGAPALEDRGTLLVLGHAFVLLGLLFKVGAVPFHFWSPDAYTGAPIPVTGFMAAVMKVGGFAALGAIWLNLLGAADGVAAGAPLALGEAVPVSARAVAEIDDLHLVLSAAAMLSLLIGNFSALGQTHVRRLLAFSSVSHAGYLLLAFTLPRAGATLHLGGLWYYLIAYAAATVGLMTAVASFSGPEDEDGIDALAGSARRQPLAGLLATLLIASLAGAPPTAGFLGKYLVLADLVGKEQVALALVAMVLAVVGAVYYLRFAIVLWSGTAAQAQPLRGLGWAVVVAASAAVTVLLAWPELGATADIAVAAGVPVGDPALGP